MGAMCRHRGRPAFHTGVLRGVPEVTSSASPMPPKRLRVRPRRDPSIESRVEPDHLDRVLTFMRLLWAVDHGMRSMSKRMRAHVGVTGPERLVLRMLGRFPGISAGELAKLLHVHPSTLTIVLSRLVRRRLVTRRAAGEDARRAVLVLTPAGEHLDRLRSGTVEARIRRALAKLPPQRIAAAQDVLSAIAEELDDQQKE